MTSEMRETCYQVSGKTIGLVGFGHIAQALARRLADFDVTLLYHDTRRAEPHLEQALQAEFVPLDTLLAQSDIASLHLPLLPATTRLVDAGFIARMKDGAVLINTARGGIVDDVALAAALKSGKLRGAELDAFEQEPPPADYPLLHMDQVAATPNIGGGVFDNVAPVASHVFRNLEAFRRCESLPDQDAVLPGVFKPDRPYVEHPRESYG